MLTLAFLKMEAISFEAILVTTDRDTINCQILFVQASFYAYRGEILSSKKITALIDGNKVTYGPDQLLNYSIFYSNSWKTYWSVNTSKRKYEFMKREVEGKLALYSSITYNSIKLRYDRHYLFIKTASQDNLYLPFNTSKKRKRIIDFLVECTQVTSLLYARDLKIEVASDWKLIAQKYNENC
jgi:hypothetical protein